MAEIVEVGSENFNQEVIEASKPVLVDFSAEWCGPCKMLKPVVDELADEWGEEVKVVELDVDHHPDIAGQFQVLGVPTLMLFVAGEVRERLTGFQPKDRINAKVSPHLTPA